MRKVYTLLVIAALTFGTLIAQPGQITLQNFSPGFSAPVDITHAGDERIFIVDQPGIIYIVNQQGVRNVTPFLNIDPRVGSGSERGLLGLAFHPKYKENGYFYVNYTNTAGNTVISRFSVTSNPDIADPNSESIILTILQPFSNHNGGCIKFGPDGYLYIGMGDGGSGGDPGNRAQNRLELLGKMLRIDIDNGTTYAIPPSNPYYGMSSTRNEIYAIGLRNPWRFSFDKINGDLWIGDVGQNVEEEIDYVSATDTSLLNFGWRCYEGTNSYNTSGCQPQNTYTQPIYTFSHASGNCSVTGGFVYRGARYASLWGYYFHTDYCGGWLWWTWPNGSGGWNTTRSSNVYSANNFSSFGEDVYGEMYVAGNSNGIIYKLMDTTCTPTAYIPGGDTVSVCMPGGQLQAFGGPTLQYQWQLNNADIVGADSAGIVPASTGDYRVIVANGSCRDTSNVVHVILGTTPTVQFSLPDTAYCDFDPSVAANVSPSGGTLSGPGVTGLNFDPAAAGIGTHILTYTYTDAGCTASSTFEVTVTVCVGISDPLLGLGRLELFPNPNNGQMDVRFTLRQPSDYRMEVLDASGRKVFAKDAVAASGLVAEQLDLSALADGFYFLKLQIDGGYRVMKFAIVGGGK